MSHVIRPLIEGTSPEVMGAVSLSYDEERLRRRLSTLPRPQAVAFAAACAARLENTTRNLGADVELLDLLSQSFDRVVAWLQGGPFFDTSDAEANLLAASPNEETHPGFRSAVAEDAAAAAVYTLQTLRSGDVQAAAWAARRAYETADRAVWITLGPGLTSPSEQAYVARHPIVQAELERQSRDLDSICMVGESGLDLVDIVMRARTEVMRLTGDANT